MQVRSKQDGSSVRNKDTICISQVLNETLFAKKPLFFCDGTVTAVSCCNLFVQNRALLNAQGIFVAKLVREVYQHRLLEKIYGRQIFCTATVFICFASSNQFCELFSQVCRKLSRKKFCLTLVYFALAALYKASLDTELRSGIRALHIRLLSEELQNLQRLLHQAFQRGVCSSRKTGNCSDSRKLHLSRLFHRSCLKSCLLSGGDHPRSHRHGYENLLLLHKKHDKRHRKPFCYSVALSSASVLVEAPPKTLSSLSPALPQPFSHRLSPFFWQPLSLFVHELTLLHCRSHFGSIQQQVPRGSRA